MNEVLYNLYAVTGVKEYADAAHRFDDERIFGPLADGRDELKGLHVNTQIPKIIGAARRYELTGDPRYRRIAEFFWTQVTQHRAYATGGTSNDEHWRSRSGQTGRGAGLLDRGVLLHLQHAEADAPPVCLVARGALFRLLRTRVVQWHSGHHESERRADHVLCAAGHGVLEGVRQPARIVLVLHRHGRRIVFEAGRQHLFPRRKRPVCEPVRVLGAGLGGEGHPHPAGLRRLPTATRRACES